MDRIRKYLLPVVVALWAWTGASALSFSLDSIAQWGRFPRFVVNTYRWGDGFFNGYDTTYVKPTGYKFNAKITLDSWLDTYNFILPNRQPINMHSDPSTSMGVYLTYLAVSGGYDLNFSKLFGGTQPARKRWRFGFNCMLFAAEAYIINNATGNTLTRFGTYHGLKLPFDAIENRTWGLDAYYFFNHKRYSEAATFNYSRIQKKSQGAFYTGFSIYGQSLNFDFSNLPPELRQQLPSHWDDYQYRVNTHNYALRAGYGYNWVFAPKWVLGVSESPVVGVRFGRVNSITSKTSLSLYNHLKVAVVWNSGRYFFGMAGKYDLAVVNNRSTTYAGGVLSGETVFGVRFNIW